MSMEPEHAPRKVSQSATLLAPAPVEMYMRGAKFTQNLCGCCEDLETCCIAFYLPCYAHGLLCQDVEASDECCQHCMLWCFASTCAGGLAPVLLGTMTRIRLRDKYGLAGDNCHGVQQLQAMCVTCMPA